MEFGKLRDIEGVDWRLPPDDPASIHFLNSLSKSTESASTRFFIGTPAWGHKEWVGRIYPPKTKAVDYLHYYSRNFNTIELNTTHYRIPTEAQVQKWISQVPKDFQFCPKLYQTISHTVEGLRDKILLREWFQFLEKLEGYRGPCFAQFSHHFDYSRKNILFHFLQQWPADFELALEFRHPSWFQEGRILPALTKYLQSRRIGLVITDVAGRRDVLHTSISADFVMLRFIGNNLHPSDHVRAKAWAERLSHWSQAGMQRMYFFVHEPEDVKAPEMANALILELNEECGADLAPLTWVV